MKTIWIYVLLTTIIIINSGCPKPCIEANYSFAATSQITPDGDSIRIEDTLYLISSFPFSLVDQQTGKPVDYSNANDIESTYFVPAIC